MCVCSLFFPCGEIQLQRAYSFSVEMKLDPLGKEVSGLGSIFGSGEGGAKLGHDVSTGVNGLADEAECGDHGKAAVLDLLELLLGVFVGGVVEVEGVPPAGVADADVAEDAVLALLLDADDALVLEPGGSGDDLVEGRLGHGGDCLKRVELGVGVDAAELVGAREGPEEARPDETDDRELRDAAVRELGLAEPLQVAHEVALLVQGVVEGREGGRGEADGVEPDVAGEGAIEGVGARSEGQGLGPLDELDVEGGGRLAVLGGGESGGRAKEEGESGDLHGGIVVGWVTSDESVAAAARVWRVQHKKIDLPPYHR